MPGSSTSSSTGCDTSSPPNSPPPPTNPHDTSTPARRCVRIPRNDLSDPQCPSATQHPTPETVAAPGAYRADRCRFCVLRARPDRPRRTNCSPIAAPNPMGLHHRHEHHRAQRPTTHGSDSGPHPFRVCRLTRGCWGSSGLLIFVPVSAYQSSPYVCPLASMNVPRWVPLCRERRCMGSGFWVLVIVRCRCGLRHRLAYASHNCSYHSRRKEIGVAERGSSRFRRRPSCDHRATSWRSGRSGALSMGSKSRRSSAAVMVFGVRRPM